MWIQEFSSVSHSKRRKCNLLPSKLRKREKKYRTKNWSGHYATTQFSHHEFRALQISKNRGSNPIGKQTTGVPG